MCATFRLTDAGRRAHGRPGLDSNTPEMIALLNTMLASGEAFSFDDIVRCVPGEMYKVLQAMATGMAMGLLEETRPPGAQPDDKNRGLGHGRW